MTYITKIHINGFASFENFIIEPKKETYTIVGTNGVGKTNFLNIVDMSVNNYEKLFHYLQQHISNSFVELSIKFDDEKIKILDDMFRLHFAYIMFDHMADAHVKIDHMIDLLKEIKCFHEGIYLKCYYEKKVIKRNLTFNQCKCKGCDTLFNNCDSHSNGCFIKDNVTKIKKLINDIKNSNWNNKLVEQVDSDILKHILYIQKNGIIIFRYNRDEYKEYYFREIESIINVRNLIEFFDNNNIITFGDIIEELSKKLKFDIEFTNFIENILSYLKVNQYMENQNIYENLKLYESEINYNNQCYNTNGSKILNNAKFSQTNLVIKNKKELDNFIFRINSSYRIRKRLYEIKNYENEIFLKIKEKFKGITNKIFDVILNSNDIEDYYYIIFNNNSYRCSNGEEELLDFLTIYYDNEKCIMMIDEPCAHLSSQNKIKFKDLFLKNQNYSNNDKQIFVITHDIELVDINNNLIYFRMNDKQITELYMLPSINEEQKKDISEHKEILFSSQCLLVEGYHDYRIMKCFLEQTGYTDYNIIITGGCTSKLYKILDEFKIEYKIIYDNDVILGKEVQSCTKKAIKFIEDRLEKNEKISDKIKILLSDILNKLKCKEKLLEDMIFDITLKDIETYFNKPYNKKHFYSYVFLKLVNTELFDNKLCSDDKIMKMKKDDIRQSLFKKDIPASVKNIDKTKSMKKINHHELEKLYQQKYEDESKQYLNSGEKINIQIDFSYNDFIKFFKQILFENNIDATTIANEINKIIDDLIDKLINERSYIFIWKSDIHDLEGFGRTIYKDEYHDNDFSKNDWQNYNDNSIRDKIKQHIDDDDLLILLREFIKY